MQIEGSAQVCAGDFCLKRLVARAEEPSPSSQMTSTLVSSRSVM